MVEQRHKIVFVHHGKALGGAPLSLLYLVEGLDKSRYNLVIACLYDDAAAALFREKGFEVEVWRGVREFAHANGAWYRFTDPRDLARLLNRLLCLLPSIFKTRSYLNETKPDLVYLNSSTLLSSAIAARLAGVPLIWHIREQVAAGYVGIRRFLLRIAVNRLPDAVIYISKADRKRWEMPGRAKAKVIYNFVDFTRFDRKISGAETRFQLGLMPTDKVVLLLGGISSIKGTRELILAMTHIRRDLTNARCVIAGYGALAPNEGCLLRRVAYKLGIRGYAANVLKLVKRSELDDIVLFTGWWENVPALIAAADVVVVPWTVAHFARPVLEAGAMARPVVCYSVDGVSEVVQDGRTGVLVPVGEVLSLATGIANLLSDEERAIEMGEQGFIQARRLFTAERNREEITAVCETVIATKSSGPASSTLTRVRSWLLQRQSDDHK
jgi:glycosyltransferase involved in cell wall biosynthesis